MGGPWPLIQNSIGPNAFLPPCQASLHALQLVAAVTAGHQGDTAFCKQPSPVGSTTGRAGRIPRFLLSNNSNATTPPSAPAIPVAAAPTLLNGIESRPFAPFHAPLNASPVDHLVGLRRQDIPYAGRIHCTRRAVAEGAASGVAQGQSEAGFVSSCAQGGTNGQWEGGHEAGTAG